MTSPDDGGSDRRHDDPAPGEPGDDTGPRPELPDDVDAAFRDIVEHYGDRPAVDLDRPVDRRSERPGGDRPGVDPGLFDTAHLDGPTDASARAEEEHFVPPEPPPVRVSSPARLLAWLGLFLPPLVMLVAVVARFSVPDWAVVLMVAAFVGGFGFLVGTMPRDHGDGDDGAVV